MVDKLPNRSSDENGNWYVHQEDMADQSTKKKNTRQKQANPQEQQPNQNNQQAVDNQLNTAGVTSQNQNTTSNNNQNQNQNTTTNANQNTTTNANQQQQQQNSNSNENTNATVTENNNNDSNNMQNSNQKPNYTNSNSNSEMNSTATNAASGAGAGAPIATNSLTNPTINPGSNETVMYDGKNKTYYQPNLGRPNPIMCSNPALCQSLVSSAPTNAYSNQVDCKNGVYMQTSYCMSARTSVVAQPQFQGSMGNVTVAPVAPSVQYSNGKVLDYNKQTKADKISLQNYSIRVINLMPQVSNGELHNKYSILNWNESHFKPICATANCSYLLTISVLDRYTAFRLFQVDLMKKNTVYYMETQVKPNLVQYIQSTQWMGNKLTLRATLKKYLEGSIKWAFKEMRILEFSNPAKDLKLDVKVYVGLDTLAETSQCSVQFKMSCNMSVGMGYQGGVNTQFNPQMNGYNMNMNMNMSVGNSGMDVSPMGQPMGQYAPMGQGMDPMGQGMNPMGQGMNALNPMMMNYNRFAQQPSYPMSPMNMNMSSYSQYTASGISSALSQHVNLLVKSLNAILSGYPNVINQSNYVELMSTMWEGPKGHQYYVNYEKEVTSRYLKNLTNLLKVGYQNGVEKDYSVQKMTNMLLSSQTEVNSNYTGAQGINTYNMQVNHQSSNNYYGNTDYANSFGNTQLLNQNQQQLINNNMTGNYEMDPSVSKISSFMK